MASSRASTQIQWASANSISLNTTAAFTSDAFLFNVEDWEADLSCFADNSGAPAAGDFVDVWVAYTTGDVKGDAADDYDTTEHAELVGRIDTVAANNPGEDPAQMTVSLRTASKGFKVIAKANQGATRAITFRAMVCVHRVQ